MTLDVVIPARGEASRLPALLETLLEQAGAVRLVAVLALNGEDVPAMRALAAEWAPRFVAAGHGLIVRESAAGKIAALRTGDAERSGGAVVYLDADARLLPGSIAALATALDDERPLLCGLPLQVALPRGGPARSFARIWRELPGMVGFVGSGLYGVTAAGRARWGDFPPVVADDAFVFSRFTAAERRIVPTGGLVVEVPSGLPLLRAVRRWTQGNRALAAEGLRKMERGIDRRWLATHRRLWRHLPGFLLVRAAARLVPSPVNDGGWRPRRSTRDGKPLDRRRSSR